MGSPGLQLSEALNCVADVVAEMVEGERVSLSRLFGIKVQVPAHSKLLKTSHFLSQMFFRGKAVGAPGDASEAASAPD